jgi:hypothetical protein
MPSALQQLQTTARRFACVLPSPLPSTRRSYATISQHIEALKAEASVSDGCCWGISCGGAPALQLGAAALCVPTSSVAQPQTQRLEELVHQLEPNIYTPDFVAEEVGATWLAACCCCACGLPRAAWGCRALNALESTCREHRAHALSEPRLVRTHARHMQLGKAAAVGSASWVLYKLVKTITPLPVSAF